MNNHEGRQFSCGQWVILGAMAVALGLVLLALVSLVRQSGGPALESPLPTAVARVTRASVTARPSPTAPAGTGTPADVEAAASGSSGAPEVQAARRIDQLGREVGQIRELPWRQEVPLSFVTEEELVGLLRQMGSGAEGQDAPPTDFAAGSDRSLEWQQTVLAALELSPLPGEFSPATARVRAGRLVAFYEPRDDQIYLGQVVLQSATPDLSLVHQYAHALIDQHFDLWSLSKNAPNADAARARDALMEGDATAVLALHSFGGVDQADLDTWAEHLARVEPTDYEGYRSSRAMEGLLLFPYREGTRFVDALLQAGWWPLVNSAYADPPESTEQVLHPEKYMSTPRDVPRPVTLPDLGEDLGEEWHLVGEEVMGELVLRAHLGQYVPDLAEAQVAAAGWDGDRAAVWRDLDGREVVVMRVLWDEPDEAVEFTTAYATLIERRLRETSRVVRPILPARGRWWRSERGDALLLREGDGVLIIWAPDTDTLERVLSVFVFAENG